LLLRKALVRQNSTDGSLRMLLFRIIPTLILSLAFSLPALAASASADVEHLHVQFVMPATTLHRGETAQAGLYFKLEKGWHVYWKNAGDSGEPPHVKWTLPQGITASELQFPAPKRLPLGPLMDFGYEDEVLFPFAVTAASDANTGAVPLHAHVSWLVCREVCIPGKADLGVQRTVTDGTGAATPDAADLELITRLGDRLPRALPASAKAGFAVTSTGYRLTIETGQRETEASFFPADQDVIANAAPQKVTPNARGLTLDLAKDPNVVVKPGELRGVLELSGGRVYEVAVPQGAPVAIAPRAAVPAVAANTANSTHSASPAFLRIMGLAFLGGLILNLMPCVFPVLFLKGLALVNSGNEERRRLRAHGLVYTVGIVVSFWALVGLLLALRSAGARLGWGFQFQSPVFLFLMAGLLFFMGLSLAGQFEIGLSMTSAGGSLAQKQGYAGSFFTGVLAVIVATPCTAPFMGAAIGYAMAQAALVTFAVFTALALGLAAPYLLLTLQPAWTRVLPSPGAWMEVLRQAVSIPIFGTVIWLAWVVSNAYGATLLAALLASFLLLAIAGWFLGRWPGKGWASALAAIFVLFVVCLGIYSSRTLTTVAAAPTPQAGTNASGEWQPWSDEAIKHYRDAGRPVFVDFTASWCLSCQVNERVALGTPEVKKALADANVVLLKADWTQHDEKIAQALEKLGRSGVPAYVLYAPGEANPRLLPEALTPGIVLDALQQLPKQQSTQTAAQAVSR
jgi:thiol:disulfide interchange protein DsbD